MNKSTKVLALMMIGGSLAAAVPTASIASCGGCTATKTCTACGVKKAACGACGAVKKAACGACGAKKAACGACGAVKKVGCGACGACGATKTN